MNRNTRIAVPVVCLAVALFCGCEKKEEAAPAAPQPQAQTQAQPPAQPQAPGAPAFSATIPAALAGTTPTPGGKANVDAINKNGDKKVNVTSEEGMDINGWAFDQKTKSVPATVVIELKPASGEKLYVSANRSSRADLAKTFNEQAYGKAGFNIKADIKSVPAGEYEVNVIQVDNGNAIVAPTGKKVNKTN